MRFLVSIPTFNEETNIGDLIDELMELPIDCVVTVVDDNSHDKTQEIVMQKIEKFSDQKVKLHIRKDEKGRGSAVWYGFEKNLSEKFDYYIEMDADFSHAPSDLLTGVALIYPQKGVFIGSRYNGGTINGWPIKRRLLSFLANVMARFLLDHTIKDYTNGFRIYSYETVKIILSVGLKNGGFIALSEIIAICLANKVGVEEFPINFRDRTNGSSNATIKEVLKSFFGLLGIAFSLRRGHLKFGTGK